MRILLTVHQFLPEYSSGTETLTLQVARDLRRLGHEVAVFTGFPSSVQKDDAARFDTYEYEGIPVGRFFHASVPMGGQSNIVEAEYNNLFFASYFRKYVAKLKPDIAHFFHLGRLSASAIDVCRDLGVPMVLTTTDFWFVCPMNQLRLPDNSLCTGPDRTGVNCLRHVVAMTQPPVVTATLEWIPNRLLELLIRLIDRGRLSRSWFAPYIRALFRRPAFLMQRMNRLDKVLVSTCLMENILRHNGLNPEKIQHMSFGIDCSHIPRHVKRRSESSIRLGFIGTLWEHKGPHVAIQAIRSLPTHLPVELRIYGNPDKFPKYSQELKCLASDDRRIVFAGTFPNQQIGEVLASLDVLIVPSLWYENTPLVIHSAQAAGCPVIASNLGGMAEVIHHGDNGLLFNPGDAAELAGHIMRLIHDEELLPKLSTRAQRPKSSSEYAAELVNIYAEILEGRTRNTGTA